MWEFFEAVGDLALRPIDITLLFQEEDHVSHGFVVIWIRSLAVVEEAVRLAFIRENMAFASGFVQGSLVSVGTSKWSRCICSALKNDCWWSAFFNVFNRR